MYAFEYFPDVKFLISASKRSCGKVMFLHVSVILFTVGGGSMIPLPLRDQTPMGPEPPYKEHGTRHEVTLYPTPGTPKAGGTHPTGLLSDQICFFDLQIINYFLWAGWEWGDGGWVGVAIVEE